LKRTAACFSDNGGVDRNRRTHGRKFSIYLPSPLDTELQRAADLESNPPSTLARRFIAAGLRRVRLEDEREPPRPESSHG
jgi:hypothetical protein